MTDKQPQFTEGEFTIKRVEDGGTDRWTVEVSSEESPICEGHTPAEALTDLAVQIEDGHLDDVSGGTAGDAETSEETQSTKDSITGYGIHFTDIGGGSTVEADSREQAKEVAEDTFNTLTTEIGGMQAGVEVYALDVMGDAEYEIAVGDILKVQPNYNDPSTAYIIEVKKIASGHDHAPSKVIGEVLSAGNTSDHSPGNRVEVDPTVYHEHVDKDGPDGQLLSKEDE